MTSTWQLTADDLQFWLVVTFRRHFDTISHSMLLKRLHDEFDISDIVLSWLGSYLCRRQQFVKMHCLKSICVEYASGVLQGLVLGPLLFAAYALPVGDVISSFIFLLMTSSCVLLLTLAMQHLQSINWRLAQQQQWSGGVLRTIWCWTATSRM